jgi:hypothetical protein
MPTIVPTNAADFAVSGTEDTLQSRSVTAKVDKKELLNKDGEVIGKSLYGKMADHTIEMANITALAAYSLGAAASAPTEVSAFPFSGTPTLVYCVDEVSVDRKGEDWAKGSVKVSEFVIED